MTSEKHGYDVFSAVMRYIRQLDLPERSSVVDSEISGLIDTVMVENAMLSMWYCLAEKVVSDTAELDSSLFNVARAIVAQLSNAVRGSGVLDEGYLRWLQQVQRDQLSFSYREVEDVYLMLSEVRWQLIQLNKQLRELLASDSFGVFSEQVTIDLAEMNRLEETQAR
jgi:hypothetical protein